MVKGVTRQVVLVRAPEDALFEQAIFFVRSDAVGKDGVTEDALLQQARQAAQQHSSGSLPQSALRRFFATRLLSALAGAGGMGLLWLLTAIL